MYAHSDTSLLNYSQWNIQTHRAETSNVRNSISRHLKFLRDEFEYSIENNSKGWYLSERTFDDSELRVLVDGVLSSKYIPENTAQKLIDRIADLGTPTLRTKKLNHAV